MGDSDYGAQPTAARIDTKKRPQVSIRNAHLRPVCFAVQIVFSLRFVAAAAPPTSKSVEFHHLHRMSPVQ